MLLLSIHMHGGRRSYFRQRDSETGLGHGVGHGAGMFRVNQTNRASRSLKELRVSSSLLHRQEPQ